MKVMICHRAVYQVVAAALLLGCSSAPGEPASSPETTSDQSLLALANDYARAIVHNDQARLSQLLSREVSDRIQEKYQGDMSRFQAKERRTLLRNFPAMGSEKQLPSFSLVKLTRQENVASAWLSIAGKNLSKPLYFVFEDGRWAVNAAPPGFSQRDKLEQAGGLAADNYSIEVAEGTQALQMHCLLNGNWVSSRKFWDTLARPPRVKPGSYGMSCSNQCGFWNGARMDWTMYRFGFVTPVAHSGKCDYNTWGTDVYCDAFAPEKGCECVEDC